MNSLSYLPSFASTQPSLGSDTTQTTDRFILASDEMNRLAQSLFIDSPQEKYQASLQESLIRKYCSPLLYRKHCQSVKTLPPKISALHILNAPDLLPSTDLLSLFKKYALIALGKTVYLVVNPVKKDLLEDTKIVFERESSNPISIAKIIPGEQDYLTVDEAGILQITDLEYPDRLQTFNLSLLIERAPSAAFQDHNVFALGTDEGTFLIDRRNPSNPTHLRESTPGEISCLDYSEDRQYLSTGNSSGQVSIFDTRRACYPLYEYKHETGVKTLGWLSPNRYLLSGNCGEKGSLKLFDITRGISVLDTPNETGISELKWCDGYLFTTHTKEGRLVSDEEGHLKMWSFDAARGLSFVQNIPPNHIPGSFFALEVKKDSTSLLVGAAKFLASPDLYFWELGIEAKKVSDCSDEIDFR